MAVVGSRATGLVVSPEISARARTHAVQPAGEFDTHDEHLVTVAEPRNLEWHSPHKSNYVE
uniref:Uncharacterized protein n=1 Tax=Oryza sativa subsp. japonica TaxID=39947 RepID=Q5Z7F2_ORYSJ|nr:hypothetical protein [Oryza sativa Japonica Group]